LQGAPIFETRKNNHFEAICSAILPKELLENRCQTKSTEKTARATLRNLHKKGRNTPRKVKTNNKKRKNPVIPKPLFHTKTATFSERHLSSIEKLRFHDHNLHPLREESITRFLPADTGRSTP
jgi:hypothetical protein